MPYWLEDDTFHATPVFMALAGGNADRADFIKVALCNLKSLASHLKSDGYLLADAALSQCRGRRWILDRLCTPVLGQPPLLHRRGDDCDCLGETAWTEGYDYRIHAFLRRNPSKREYDRNRAQKADLRDARLKAQVYQRDGGCCRYCTSGPLSPKAGRSKDRRKILTFDHVNPDQVAGPLAENLAVACGRCNEEKGHRTPDEADLVLQPAPTTAAARALLDRAPQLHDRPPGSAADQRPITDEPATDHPNTDQEQRHEHQPVTDPIADPISDRIGDPIADPAPPVRPSPTRSPNGSGPDQAGEASGLGRGGPPDLIGPAPPYPGQPHRGPAYPDVYTRRSRAAPPDQRPHPPPPEYQWPPGSVPADPIRARDDPRGDDRV